MPSKNDDNIDEPEKKPAAKLSAAERAATIPDLAHYKDNYKDVETVKARLHDVYRGARIPDELARDLIKFVKELTKMVEDGGT